MAYNKIPKVTSFKNVYSYISPFKFMLNFSNMKSMFVMMSNGNILLKYEDIAN